METTEYSFVGFEEFILRQSIWENIEKLVECVDERNEIKKIIGQSLIDETLDLHTELLTLHGIWKDYHEEITNTVCKPPIPEPPLLRENLEKQISMMVQLLQSKLAKQGNRSISAFLTDGEKALIKSVSAESKSKQDASRRQSTSSRGSAGSGRERDHTESRRGETTTPSSGYESRCSSGLSVDMNALQENINVMDIDSIAQSLREDFEDERRLLLNDISYVQNAMILENEQQEREKHARQSSPTIKDLRKLTVKLEKEILQKDILKSPSASKSSASPKNHRLSPLSQPKKASSSPGKVIKTAKIDLTSELFHSNTLVSGNTERVPYAAGNEAHLPSLTPSPPCSERSERTSTANNLRKTINMRKMTEGTVS